VLLEKWIQNSSIHGICTIGLWGHEIYENNHSENFIVWDKPEDESEEKFYCLPCSKNNPEA